MIAVEDLRNNRVVIIGLALVATGLIMDYVLERHNIFKVLENSPYPISWSDIFYPPLCLLLCIAGGVFAVGGMVHGVRIQSLLQVAVVIAVPATVLYSFFLFGMQFIQTGADRLGECDGLDNAAASSNVIPESKWRPGHPAIGCAAEKRGIFLSYYDDITVYGVTDPASQNLVLEKLAEHYREQQTHPVQVRFFQKENWSERKGKNGTTFGSRGPEKLIRVANIG